MAIKVVEYDDAWPRMADLARAELHASLPGIFTQIEHIGSTSVPGLAAKPIIDLMAATNDLDQVVARDVTLDHLGYSRHETGMPGRLFYRRCQDGERAYHLHVVPAGTLSSRNELLLRDHLRSHPPDARRYGALKHELALRHAASADYTAAKTELIQELVDNARAAKGLPAVPVWEE